jgi:hypothetical protein
MDYISTTTRRPRSRQLIAVSLLDLQEERNALPVPASRPDDARVGNVGLAEPLDEMARIGEGVDVVPGSGAAR